jgi:hypothetical protein
MADGRLAAQLGWKYQDVCDAMRFFVLRCVALCYDMMRCDAMRCDAANLTARRQEQRRIVILPMIVFDRDGRMRDFVLCYCSGSRRLPSTDRQQDG